MAAPYEQWNTLAPGPGGGRQREKIRAGAFTGTLATINAGTRNVHAFAAHAHGRVLADTRTGTLRLRDTTEGLRYALDLPDTNDGRDILRLIDIGLLGVSIGFRMKTSQMKTGVDVSDGTVWRVLTNVDLAELSLVAAPAYKGTSAVLLSSDDDGRQGLGLLALRALRARV